MTEMQYSGKRKIELLDKGEYRGYKFYIFNLGTHPTAYVRIPKEHRFYKFEDYDNIPIDCHGGLTYMGNTLMLSENHELIDGSSKFIGWDYAHFGDFYGGELFSVGKRWTTEEIVEEVTDVIDQLKRFENPFYYWWYCIKRKFRK